MPIHPCRKSNAVVRPELAGGYAVAILAGSGLGIGLLVVLAALFGFSLSPLTWYLARSSGMTLYLLLWFSVATGLLFAATAYGFGEKRVHITLPFGLALAVLVWFIFARLLKLTLPEGPPEHWMMQAIAALAGAS